MDPSSRNPNQLKDKGLKELSDWDLVDLHTDPATDPDLSSQTLKEIQQRQTEGTFKFEEPEPSQQREIGNYALRNYEDGLYDKIDELPGRQRVRRRPHPSDNELFRIAEAAEKSYESKLETTTREIYNYYSKHLYGYTKTWVREGTKDLIEQGKFDFSTQEAASTGFKTKELTKLDQEFDPHVSGDPSTQPSSDIFEAKAQTSQKIQELVGSYLSRLPEEKTIPQIRQGIVDAIEGGARTEGEGQQTKTIYAFPLGQKDDFLALMREYGLETKIPEKDPDDAEFPNAAEAQKLRLSAETGFFNIINAVKDQPKEMKRAKQYLDWYYDTFEFAKHANELENNIVDEEYSGDELYREFRDAYLASKPDFTRPSYGSNDGENAQNSDNLSGRDRQIIEEHVLTEGKAEYEDMGTIFNRMIDQMSTMMVHDADGKEMFPVACLMQYGEGYSQKLRELGVQSQEAERVIRTIRCIDRCNAGFAVAKRIHDEIDPHADFSIDAVYRDKNTGEKVLNPGNIQLESRVYLSIRFGTENKDVKIAFPITGADAAMFGWAGDTHFDPNAWQSVFERSIKDRNPEVRKTTSNNHSTLGEEAILRQWDRMFSKIGLRSVQPFSALRGANAEQASSADRARLLDVREAIPFDELVKMCENGTVSKNPDVAKLVTRRDPAEFIREEAA